MTKRVLGAAFALALTLGLAACGSSSTGTATSSTAPSTTSETAATAAGNGSAAVVSTEHNAVDVMFATMMIPHHEGAIEMSELALAQASTQPVKDLATQIKAAQGPEIEQMQGWLVAWDATMPMMSTGADADSGMGGHDMGSMGGPQETAASRSVDDFGMGQMMQMSDADMDALRAATGVEFDKLFLQQMIAHHQGAIEMAEVEIARGQNPATLALAESIKSGQTAEIAQMQQMLAAL